jgi:glyoxylate reductase
MRQRVYITRRLPGRAAEILAAAHVVQRWDSHDPVPRGVLLREVASAQGLLCLLTERVDAELLDAAPDLRVVANMAVGYDNVDVAACRQRGVVVTNTPGVLTEATADFAFALILAGARKLHESANWARAGHWQTWSPTGFLGLEAHGATLGIVGMGAIGQAVARRAAGFEMRVLYTSRTMKPGAPGKRVDLDELLRESDIVSLHVPLTAQTRQLIGVRELHLMKDGALLVNTARGGVVGQDALVAELRTSRISAALDVTDPEPLPPEHELYRLPNCLVTPHIASAGRATRARMAELAAENILAVLAGKPALTPV